MSNTSNFIQHTDDTIRIYKFPNKDELKKLESKDIINLVDLLVQDCVANFHVRMNQNQFMTNLALELTDRMRKEGPFNKEMPKDRVKAENKQESIAYDPSKSISANFGRDTIEGKLSKILVETLGIEPDKIYMSSRFQDDLGTDSLDNIEIVMYVEEEFNIEITDEQGELVLTFEEAVKFIKDRVE